MKKSSLLLWLFAAVLIGFNSCSDDDDPLIVQIPIEIPAPEGGYIFDAGESVTINPGIELQENDQVSWAIAGEVVSDQLILVKQFDEAGTYTAVLTILNKTANYEKTGTATIAVMPYISLNLSDFDLSDGIETAGGVYWSGTYDDDAKQVDSRIFSFGHTSISSYSYWYGFTVSNSNDNSEQSDFLTNQFCCMAKGGVRGESTPYMVSYAASQKKPKEGEVLKKSSYTWMEITDDDNRYKVAGAYVSNQSWAYYSMLNGDSGTPKFAQGDYFLLQVYAVGADGIINIEPVEFYLGDYRSANESEWKLNNSWEWMDLSALGEVKYLIFRMESTVANDYGPLTPTYFCLDRIAVEKIN